MNYIARKNGTAGYVIITLAVLFAALGLTLVLGGAVPVTSHYVTSKGYGYSKQAQLASNSGVNEVIYRLQNSMNLPNLVQLTLATGSTTVSIATTPSGKRITALGGQNRYQRNALVDVVYGSGIAFNYGLQAGNGGISIDGGSTINGNVYSNGDVDAISATITGTAVAADSAPLTAGPNNDAPASPPTSINFRNVSGSQDIAMSFIAATTTALNKIQLYIKKTGSPANATVRIVTDSAGSPSTTEVPTGGVSLTATAVGTTYSWVDVPFTAYPSLSAGTTYWIVIDNSTQNATNYYTVGSNSTFATGATMVGAYSGTWTSTSTDAYFIVYSGGVTGLVGGATYAGGLTLGGDAWATTVRGTSATGAMYCTTGTNNNKACNTSRGGAPQLPMPFTDDDIQSWYDEAAGGGTYTGDLTVGWAGLALGPRVINGNLTVNGGGTLTLNGTVRVTGNLTVTGGGKIVLPSSYGLNSGTIITDGRISVAGGGSAGSGNASSYLFVVSTSKCPNDTNCGGNPAITISGGAGAIAANAQEGTVDLHGGASIKAVTGKTITVTGGSTVTYDSGLASPSFTSGPSGGFTISGWREQ